MALPPEYKPCTINRTDHTRFRTMLDHPEDFFQDCLPEPLQPLPLSFVRGATQRVAPHSSKFTKMLPKQFKQILKTTCNERTGRTIHLVGCIYQVPHHVLTGQTLQPEDIPNLCPDHDSIQYLYTRNGRLMRCYHTNSKRNIARYYWDRFDTFTDQAQQIFIHREDEGYHSAEYNRWLELEALQDESLSVAKLARPERINTDALLLKPQQFGAHPFEVDSLMIRCVSNWKADTPSDGLQDHFDCHFHVMRELNWKAQQIADEDTLRRHHVINITDRAEWFDHFDEDHPPRALVKQYPQHVTTHDKDNELIALFPSICLSFDLDWDYGENNYGMMDRSRTGAMCGYFLPPSEDCDDASYWEQRRNIRTNCSGFANVERGILRVAGEIMDYFRDDPEFYAELGDTRDFILNKILVGWSRPDVKHYSTSDFRRDFQRQIDGRSPQDQPPIQQTYDKVSRTFVNEIKSCELQNWNVWKRIKQLRVQVRDQNCAPALYLRWTNTIFLEMQRRMYSFVTEDSCQVNRENQDADVGQRVPADMPIQQAGNWTQQVGAQGRFWIDDEGNTTTEDPDQNQITLDLGKLNISDIFGAIAQHANPLTFALEGASQGLDKAFELLQFLKPVNTTEHVMKIIRAPTWSEKIAGAIRLAETHGILWETKLLQKVFQHAYRALNSAVSSCGLEIPEEGLPKQQAGVNDDDKTWTSSMLGFECPTLSPVAFAAVTIGCSIAAMLGLTIVTRGGDSQGFLSKWGKDFGLLARGITSIGALFMQIYTGVKWFLTSVCGFKIDDPQERNRERLISALTELRLKVSHIVSDLNANMQDFLLNPGVYTEITRSADKLYAEILEEHQRKNFNSHMKLATEMWEEAKKLKKLICTAQTQCGFKQTPACIWIYGKTGCGKTNFCKYLAKRLQQRSGRLLLQYQRKATNKHWDGYQGQPIVIFDDIGSKIGQDDLGDFASIMDAGAWITPQADLQDKGKPFCSTIVVCTSNFPTIDAKELLRDPEITMRRRHIVVEMVDKTWTKETAGDVRRDIEDFQEVEFHLKNPMAVTKGRPRNFYDQSGDDSCVVEAEWLVEEVLKIEARERAEFQKTTQDQAGFAELRSTTPHATKTPKFYPRKPTPQPKEALEDSDDDDFDYDPALLTWNPSSTKFSEQKQEIERHIRVLSTCIRQMEKALSDPDLELERDDTPIDDLLEARDRWRKELLVDPKKQAKKEKMKKMFKKAKSPKVRTQENPEPESFYKPWWNKRPQDLGDEKEKALVIPTVATIVKQVAKLNETLKEPKSESTLPPSWVAPTRGDGRCLLHAVQPFTGMSVQELCDKIIAFTANEDTLTGLFDMDPEEIAGIMGSQAWRQEIADWILTGNFHHEAATRAGTLLGKLFGIPIAYIKWSDLHQRYVVQGAAGDHSIPVFYACQHFSTWLGGELPKQQGGNVEMTSRKIPVFLGPAGTGKTHLATKFSPDKIAPSELRPEFINGKTLHISDFTSTAENFEAFRAFVMEYYDKSTTEGVVATGNGTTFEKRLSDLVEEDQDLAEAFLRRLEIYDFKFKNKFLGWSSYTRDDVDALGGDSEKITTLVSIHKRSTLEAMTQEECLSEVFEAKARNTQVYINTSLLRLNPASYTHIVQVDMTLRTLLERPLSSWAAEIPQVIAGTSRLGIRLIKGCFTDKGVMHLFTSLTGKHYNRMGTVEKYLQTINNSRIKSVAPCSLKIICRDTTLVAVTDDDLFIHIGMLGEMIYYKRDGVGYRTDGDGFEEEVDPDFFDFLCTLKGVVCDNDQVPEPAEVPSGGPDEVPPSDEAQFMNPWLRSLFTLGNIFVKLLSVFGAFWAISDSVNNTGKEKKRQERATLEQIQIPDEEQPGPREARSTKNNRRAMNESPTGGVTPEERDSFLLEANAYDIPNNKKDEEVVLEKKKGRNKKAKTPEESPGKGQHDWRMPNRFRLEEFEELSEELEDLSDDIQAEATKDPQCDALIDLLPKKMVRVLGGQNNTFAYGIHYRGRCVVTVKHLGKGPFWIQPIQGGDKWKARSVFQSQKKDFQILEMEEKAPQGKDITGHFRARGLTGSVEHQHGVLMIPNRINHGSVNCWNVTLEKEQLVSCLDANDSVQTTLGAHYKVAAGGIASPNCTRPGDCGAPVLLKDPKSPKKLLGIHTAGNQSVSQMCFITQEDLIQNVMPKEKIESLPYQQCVFDPDCEAPNEEKAILIDSTGEQIKMHRPKKTSFWRSPLEWKERLKYYFEPSVLDAKDPRMEKPVDPMKQGLEKWIVPPPRVHLASVEAIAEEVADYLAYNVQKRGIKTKVFSKKEAINRNTAYVDSNPLYRRSSAGFPWSTEPGVRQKDPYIVFNESEGIHEINMEHALGRKLNASIDQLVAAAVSGKRTATVFQGSLKDEPLKKEKIKIGKTRSFAASPLDYTIAVRQYFGAATAALKTTRDLHPIKVGINPHSREWDLLAKSLKKKGPYCFDYDVKRWDSSLPRVFIEQVPTIWNRIYQKTDPFWKPSDDVIRTNLHKAIHGPLIANGSSVLQMPGGMASGYPCTVEENSITHLMMVVYLWKMLCMLYNKPKDWGTLRGFLKRVSPVIYGDDYLNNVSPNVRHMWNFSTVSKAFKHLLRYEVCSPDKESDERRITKSLEQCTFLHRRFVQHEDLYLGPLTDDSIEKMLSLTQRRVRHVWTDEDQTISYDMETIQATMYSFMREAVLQGKPFFQSAQHHLERVSREYEIPIPPMESFEQQFLELIDRSPIR
ncbi:hypothetical protein 1 [Beihai picorna-like virus 119]|uniref:hypothetical protein 1 n=1 Tax=Beihai picorna-like virus 119 TaxID=1922548 RepID=UPI00090C96EA|nr:hypothetical protein 1 [Beihai picorna-like virus 119]APG76817.1 hypothetical protein 1 [Beihai picorna-like virus 119]